MGKEMAIRVDAIWQVLSALILRKANKKEKAEKY